MAKKIEIAGELVSTATGNKVADVANIKDKTQGDKSQAQINAEHETALADRYTKAETYNKTELNNMITTPNQQYVSVMANSQTTSVTDVLPSTGAANTVYRVGNWDGSQYDVTVYSEYAWNGSQYVHISTKTKIGEVFDISAYHATGGELAKYADLTAALGTNGANVPQSLRKGGMSVKFVQSSDNKYVQCRLMSDTFSTTVANWQGVDDEPTAGSENLVKSGSVFNISGGTCRIDIPNDSSEHSSTKDRIKIFIPANTIFSVTSVDNSGNINNFIVYVRYKGSETFVSIPTKVIDNKPCFVAINDIEEIGLYFTTTIRGLVHFEIGVISINDRFVDIEGTKLYNYFIGNNNTYSRRNIYGLIRGNTYRVYLKTTTWDITGASDVTTNVFEILSYNVNNVNTSLVSVKVRDFSTIKPYYDVTIPADSEYVSIGGRAALLEKVFFSIVDITKSNSDRSEIDIQLSGDETRIGNVENGFNGLSFATNYNPAKVQEGVLAVGSWYRANLNTSNDCLGYRNKFKVQPGSKLNCVHANDIKIRIVQFGENKNYLTQNETYSYIDSVTLRNDTYYVAISADYSERGFSAQNPVSLSDFVEGDFGIVLPSVDIEYMTENLSQEEKDTVRNNIGIIVDNVLDSQSNNPVSNSLLTGYLLNIGETKQFTSTKSGEHSSTLDVLNINIHAGETFFVDCITEATFTGYKYVYVKYIDEESTTNIGYFPTGLRKYKAQKDIEAVSFYWYKSGTVPVTMKVGIDRLSFSGGKKLSTYGFDDTPTENSENLVDSSHILAYLKSINAIKESTLDYNQDAYNRLLSVMEVNGHYGHTQNQDGNWCSFLMMTDTHYRNDIRDVTLRPITRCFELGENSAFDVILHGGDIVEGSGEYSTLDWKGMVLGSTKPVLAVPGNHEYQHITNSTRYIGLTDEETYNLLYDSDMVTHNGEVHPVINNVAKNYWYKDIEKNSRTIRMIGIYQYEWNPETEQHDGSGKDVAFYTQEQIDWLVDLLKNTPLSYGVILFSHQPINAMKYVDTEFVPAQMKGSIVKLPSALNQFMANSTFFYSIIDAWVKGGTCNVTTDQITTDNVNHPVSVNTTFDGGGIFIANICGHRHEGGFCHMVDENDVESSYRIVISPTTNNTYVQNTGWWRRTYNTDITQDCLNVYVYHFKNDKLITIRFGTSVNNDGGDAKAFSF